MELLQFYFMKAVKVSNHGLNYPQVKFQKSLVKIWVLLSLTLKDTHFVRFWVVVLMKIQTAMKIDLNRTEIRRTTEIHKITIRIGYKTITRITDKITFKDNFTKETVYVIIGIDS